MEFLTKTVLFLGILIGFGIGLSVGVPFGIYKGRKKIKQQGEDAAL